MKIRAPQSPRLRRLLIPALLAAVAAGCASVPPLALSEPGIVIRADDRAVARETRDLVRTLTPRLLALDAGLTKRPVEIWIHETVATDAIYGGVDLQGRMHLERVREHPHFSLAHELVHVYEGPRWDRLPAVMQEGLAEWCAAAVVPEVRARMRVYRAAYLASWIGDGLVVPSNEDDEVIVTLSTEITEPVDPLTALRIPRGGINAVTDGEMLRALYGFGYLIVERIGPARLAALCDRARRERLPLVPAEWLLDESGLASGPDAWWEAIHEMVAGEEEQRLLRNGKGGGLP